MSNGIILKSILAIVAAGLILSFSSCMKDEKKIIGEWKYEKTELKEFACSDPLVNANAKPMAQKYFEGTIIGDVEFTEDGKAIFVSNMYGEMVGTYTLSNSKLTLVTPSRTEVYDISFSDKKTMCLNRDADKLTLDSLHQYLQQFFIGEIEVKVTKCNITTILTKK